MTEVCAADAWIAVESCPACRHEGLPVGRLFTQDGHLGGVKAPPPPAPIELRRCVECGLIYKSLLASPALLERLTAAAHSQLWTAYYDYAAEIAAVEEIGGRAALLDAIDVGAAGGGFLDALPREARKSALDIFRFDTLKINGEFVKGFLDAAALDWSGEPYRLVGLFDVAEHLYDPPQAFVNLRKFCRPGGVVIIETGDSDSISVEGLTHWYYLNLLEHHVAWNRKSLTALAERSGFEVASFRRKQHKNVYKVPAGLRLKILAFEMAPRLLAGLYRVAGRMLDVPPDISRTDHMQIILKAV